MARKEKINFVKVRKCLPFLHSYSRSYPHPSINRYIKVCSKCGHSPLI